MPFATEIVTTDVEAAIRTWARSLTLDAGPGKNATGRVFFATPKDPIFPLVTLRQVGGSPVKDLPINRPQISFTVWAKAGGKVTARVVADALVDAINALPCGRPMGDNATVAYGAEVVLGPVWHPDPEAHLAGYVVDAVFDLRPV